MENQVLQQILNELKELKQGQAKLEAGQAKLEAGQAKLEAGQAELRTDVDSLRGYVVTKIEHDLEPKVGALLDGMSIVEKRTKRLDVIDALQDDVSTLKGAVRYLSQELEALKNAM